MANFYPKGPILYHFMIPHVKVAFMRLMAICIQKHTPHLIDLFLKYLSCVQMIIKHKHYGLTHNFVDFLACLSHVIEASIQGTEWET